jgi:hypothetical protein
MPPKGARTTTITRFQISTGAPDPALSLGAPASATRSADAYPDAITSVTERAAKRDAARVRDASRCVEVPPLSRRVDLPVEVMVRLRPSGDGVAK